MLLHIADVQMSEDSREVQLDKRLNGRSKAGMAVTEIVRKTGRGIESRSRAGRSRSTRQLLLVLRGSFGADSDLIVRFFILVPALGIRRSFASLSTERRCCG